MSLYTLTPILDAPQFTVTIQADANDADYQYETQTYTPEQFDYCVAKQLIFLKQTAGGHYELDKFNQHEFYTRFIDRNNTPEKDVRFCQLKFPPGENWNDCHTLKEITVTYRDHESVFHIVELDYEAELVPNELS